MMALVYLIPRLRNKFNSPLGGRNVCTISESVLFNSVVTVNRKDFSDFTQMLNILLEFTEVKVGRCS